MSIDFFNPYDWIAFYPNAIPEQQLVELNKVPETDINGPSRANYGHKYDETEKQEDSVRLTNWYTMNYSLYDQTKKSFEGFVNNVILPRYGLKTFKSFEDIQFLSYPVGGHYVVHNDSEYFNDDLNKWERVAPRDISVIMYLNDNFEGGELEFPELGLTIKPQRGLIITFPSYCEFAHGVKPVIKGERNALVTWIETHDKMYDIEPTPK